MKFNEYDLLYDAGKVQQKVAKAFAEAEYEKFRKIQDKEFESDFDRTFDKIKQTGTLPEESMPHSPYKPLKIKGFSLKDEMAKFKKDQDKK